jgi:hypothetical protein
MANATRKKKRSTEKANVPAGASEMASGDFLERVPLERSERMFDVYRRAFSGFSYDETAILNGIILERPQRRKRHGADLRLGR